MNMTSNIKEIAPYIESRRYMLGTLISSLRSTHTSFKLDPVAQAVFNSKLAYMPASVSVYVPYLSAANVATHIAGSHENLQVRHLYGCDTEQDGDFVYVAELAVANTEKYSLSSHNDLVVYFHQLIDYDIKNYGNIGDVLTSLLNISPVTFPLVGTATMLAEATHSTTIQHLELLNNLIQVVSKQGDQQLSSHAGTRLCLGTLYRDERYMDTCIADFLAHSIYWKGICRAILSHEIQSDGDLRHFLPKYIGSILSQMKNRVAQMYDVLSAKDKTAQVDKHPSHTNLTPYLVNNQNIDIEDGLFDDWKELALHSYRVIEVANKELFL